MDFVSDSTVTGRRFRALAIVDDYSRECPAIEVDTSLGGARVVGVLERLEETRGLPEVITVDNGPEFAGKAMDEWACRRGIKLSFIRPGKPVENAFAESFNGRLRDECLNINWFMSVRHAREIIDQERQAAHATIQVEVATGDEDVTIDGLEGGNYYWISMLELNEVASGDTQFLYNQTWSNTDSNGPNNAGYLWVPDC